jgi:Tfp pilus assembly protein PilN
MIKAARHIRGTSSNWVVQLYTDGLLFWVYLLTISLASILLPILAPPIFTNWLAVPQRIFHSILCTRVLLLILRQRNLAHPSLATLTTFTLAASV